MLHFVVGMEMSDCCWIDVILDDVGGAKAPTEVMERMRESTAAIPTWLRPLVAGEEATMVSFMCLCLPC